MTDEPELRMIGGYIPMSQQLAESGEALLVGGFDETTELLSAGGRLARGARRVRADRLAIKRDDHPHATKGREWLTNRCSSDDASTAFRWMPIARSASGSSTLPMTKQTMTTGCSTRCGSPAMADQPLSDSVDLVRPGVIVGIASAVDPEHAVHLREQLEARFPGVTFAVVDQCVALVSFTFDDEDSG